METKITGSEIELNSLFKEILDGVRDDLNEVQRNVELYFDAINETGGKEIYGVHYNESLKIKGAARDRQLKFLNMFKDRVSKKESMIAGITATKENDSFLSQKEMNEAIASIKNKNNNLVKPQISINPISISRSEDEDDYDNELEMDLESEE